MRGKRSLQDARGDCSRTDHCTPTRHGWELMLLEKIIKCKKMDLGLLENTGTYLSMGLLYGKGY